MVKFATNGCCCACVPAEPMVIDPTIIVGFFLVNLIVTLVAWRRGVRGSGLILSLLLGAPIMALYFVVWKFLLAILGRAFYACCDLLEKF